jgi:hypothetical protein
MSLPVPTRIVAEMADAIGNLSLVGAVSELDPKTAQAGRSEEWLKAISAASSAGKFAVELSVGPAMLATPESEGSHKLNLVESFSMEVAGLCHLPDPIKPADFTPDKLAKDLFAAIYALAAPTESAGQCGVWYEYAGTDVRGAALAMNTDVVGGGEVFLTDIGTRATWFGLEVYFRVRRGDMTQTG